MRIGFFEDAQAQQFAPIALTRPVFELICGQFSLRERIVRSADVSDWGAFVRPYLAEAYREEHPEAAVNDSQWLAAEPTLLINGRWNVDPAVLTDLPAHTVGLVDGTIVYLTVDPREESLLDESDWDAQLSRLAARRSPLPAPGTLFRYPWELVEHNREQLVFDFQRLDASPPGGALDQIAVLGPLDQVHIDPSASIDPFVVIDARQGSVSIGPGATVQAFTRLEGPCHIGRKSLLFRANIRAGTTVGPVCRVGGEIEASILHGYVNKYHDGFLGHSYVCPWVNLGAETTNSDLKNDYSPIRVPLGGTAIDTGSVKVGCFIGDHTKTGLGCLFNTGSAIGVMCMLLPGGELLPKHIPSFARVWHGALEDGFPLLRMLEAARAAMARRDVELTAAQERLLRTLHTRTRVEREAALLRARERSATPGLFHQTGSFTRPA